VVPIHAPDFQSEFPDSALRRRKACRPPSFVRLCSWPTSQDTRNEKDISCARSRVRASPRHKNEVEGSVCCATFVYQLKSLPPQPVALEIWLAIVEGA